MINASYIDINQILSSLKEKYKLETVEDTPNIIESELNRGVIFNGTFIKVTSIEFFGPLIKKNCKLFFFECPKCKKRVRKIFAEGNRVAGCRKCSKMIKQTTTRTQADKIIYIQKNINELLDKSKFISKKKKSTLQSNIIKQYNNLNPAYKSTYNGFMFKEIQNWCISELTSEKSKEYKQAIKDMLEILRDSRKILVKTGLMTPKKNKVI